MLLAVPTLMMLTVCWLHTAPLYLLYARPREVTAGAREQPRLIAAQDTC